MYSSGAPGSESIAIVGNGIVGALSALRIKQGNPTIQVTLFGPKARTLAGSTAAAAMLNSFAEVEASNRFDPFFAERFHLSRLSASLWPDLLSELGGFAESGRIDCGFGTFVVNNFATTPLEGENFDEILRVLAEWEEPHELVEPSSIDGYRPEYSKSASRAIWLANEGWVEPLTFLEALDSAIEAAGVQIKHAVVDSICENGGGIKISGQGFEGIFDRVLVAAGANSRSAIDESLWPAGPRLYWGNGLTLRVRTSNSTGQEKVIRTPNRGLACGIYTAPYSDGSLVIGATNFVTATPDSAVLLGDISTIVESARSQVNTGFETAALVATQKGARAISEDGRALIGPLEDPRIFVMTGLRREGWHLAPLLANLAASFVQGKELPDYLQSFSPSRVADHGLTLTQCIDLAVDHYMSGMFQHGSEIPSEAYRDQVEGNYRLFFGSLMEKLEMPLIPEMLGVTIRGLRESGSLITE